MQLKISLIQQFRCDNILLLYAIVQPADDADAEDCALSAVEEDTSDPRLNLSRIFRNIELFLLTGCCCCCGTTNWGRIGPPPIPLKFGIRGVRVEHSAIIILTTE